MTSTDGNNATESIRTELESTHEAFRALLESLSEEDMRRQSLNPGWTNGEILAHVLFGFIILNVLLPMARIWGRLPSITPRLCITPRLR